MARPLLPPRLLLLPLLLLLGLNLSSSVAGALPACPTKTAGLASSSAGQRAAELSVHNTLRQQVRAGQMMAERIR